MNQPRLLSFTLDGWGVLGGPVSLSLVNQVGVLVGRNGAGKSAILEGFEAISSCAIGRSIVSRMIDSDSIPTILQVEILTPTNRRLGYRYELIIPFSMDDLDTDIDDTTDDNSLESSFTWNDSCHYIDGDQELLWKTEFGLTSFNNNGEPIFAILGNTTSLRQSNVPGNSSLNLPPEMKWVYAILKGIRLLGKAPIRRTSRRQPSLLKVASKKVSTSRFDLADTLARRIFYWVGTDYFDELENVCQRIGLAKKITVQKFVLSEHSGQTGQGKDEEYIASVLLDGVNIGLLSDGTLRVLSILIEIIAHSPNATTIIEEPETQIHPAMLAKLLNEIKSYTWDENLIISTHSPQVVAWTKPENISLVYRNQGRTSVRKLEEGEIEKVVEYLCEEGDLGDWIYSGILDE
ncbi:MAG: ATP-binding protein [Microcystis novacekii Mn_MB_F_20050700_S1]|uniref:ATP-binding protein n=1 Tax=Microcystis novacekii Mn_MB_F_20050700_S1D TaxID=2486266 RepID=A0A552IGS3_9CHRO|nr:MAG: ATP-binding protein [Microcystis novacekii Mn_MB_F_20050700_S1D]TRU82734.1 MAG: ATP-binding protein [Microcystis novacekii Mn_MB_F_20050700_S1]